MGVFMRIRRRNSANAALHYLLARELTPPEVPMLERWFLVSGRIIRFTPEAFCLITGLFFGPTDFDPTAAHTLFDGSLYNKFFGQPTKASKLRTSFTGLKVGEDPNDYLKAANLLVFYFFLLCRDDPGVEYCVKMPPSAQFAQTDSHSCGPFCCMYIERMISARNLHQVQITEKYLKSYRRMVAMEIFSLGCTAHIL